MEQNFYTLILMKFNPSNTTTYPIDKHDNYSLSSDLIFMMR